MALSPRAIALEGITSSAPAVLVALRGFIAAENAPRLSRTRLRDTGARLGVAFAAALWTSRLVTLPETALVLAGIRGPVFELANVPTPRGLVRHNETPRRILSLATTYTLARIPTGDNIVIAGFTETIVLQCLAAGVAVDLSAWTSVKVQTSQDGRTWTDQTTTVTTAASGIVTAVLSSAITGALTAPGVLKIRVSAVDADLKVRVFPDDADLYVTLRVQR